VIDLSTASWEDLMALIAAFQAQNTHLRDGYHDE
jgi:hypothetical protein